MNFYLSKEGSSAQRGQHQVLGMGLVLHGPDADGHSTRSTAVSGPVFPRLQGIDNVKAWDLS